VKSSIAVFFLWISFLSSFAQSRDPKYYVFGTLRDYSFTSYCDNKSFPNSKFEVRFRGKIAEMRRMEEVTSIPFKPESYSEECKFCDTTYKWTAKNPSWKLKTFYRFNRGELCLKWTSPTEGEIRLWRWTCELRKDVILKATKQQKLSYLAGVFQEFEDVENDTISLNLYEAPAKMECVKELLNEFGCVIVVDEQKVLNHFTVRNNLFSISFIPTDEILSLFNEEVKRKKQFSNTIYTK